MLSHRNLMAMTVAHLADMDNPDHECSLVHAAPMSHGSGLYIPAYVSRGARQVISERGGFEPAEFLDLCEHHPGCSAFLAPTMVQRVVETGRARPGQLRTIIYGSGPMYVDSIKKALAAFGPVFAQIYGQGESPMTITGLRRADHEAADDAVLGSVGYQRSGTEVAVLRADGTPAEVGEIGEIVCRGDVVISGGSNIYPREVEEALLEHPQVSEACVVGAPDQEWGEVVVAFIVIGAADEIDTADLDAHLLTRIARFKRPKRYLAVDSLPKNGYGKVLKKDLRQQLV
jgi:fatty-acyl-CoA synthase